MQGGTRGRLPSCRLWCTGSHTRGTRFVVSRSLPCSSRLLVGSCYCPLVVSCSSLVRLGEGRERAPPPHGRGQLFAGASRSRVGRSRHSRGLLGSQCRVSFRRAARRESPCCAPVPRPGLLYRGARLVGYLYTPEVPDERGRTCLYRQPLTLGCHGGEPCPFVVCLGVGSRARPIRLCRAYS